MNSLFVTLVILVICVFSCFIRFTDKDDIIQLLKEFSIICMILVSIVLIAYSTTKPTAMDVYQGKTTLEITYKNGVPVDSVVVWKGDEK